MKQWFVSLFAYWRGQADKVVMMEWDLHMFCKLPLILFFPSPRMGILNFSNVSPREMSMNTWKQQEWTILQSIYGRYLKSCHFENF